MTSTLKIKPAAMPGIEFYNKDGKFTEETTADYQGILEFCVISEKNNKTRYTKEKREADADNCRSIRTHDPVLRLRAQEKVRQASARKNVVKMRNSEIAFIKEKLRNNT